MDDDDGNDTEPNSPSDYIAARPPRNPFLGPQDPEEAYLEAREAHKYILAKSYFDAREYDRCSAVFLPASSAAIPLGALPAKPKATPRKGKPKESRA
ncbi:Anaphase-promoting complex subunit 23, partial [Ascosphaera aggregata]